MADLNYQEVELEPARPAITHAKARVASILITQDPVSNRVEVMVRYSLHAAGGAFVRMGPTQKYNTWGKVPQAIKPLILALRDGLLEQDAGDVLEAGSLG